MKNDFGKACSSVFVVVRDTQIISIYTSTYKNVLNNLPVFLFWADLKYLTVKQYPPYPYPYSVGGVNLSTQRTQRYIACLACSRGYYLSEKIMLLVYVRLVEWL